jgi:hypothetical protein
MSAAGAGAFMGIKPGHLLGRHWLRGRIGHPANDLAELLQYYSSQGLKIGLV